MGWGLALGKMGEGFSNGMVRGEAENRRRLETDRAFGLHERQVNKQMEAQDFLLNTKRAEEYVQGLDPFDRERQSIPKQAAFATNPPPEEKRALGLEEGDAAPVDGFEPAPVEPVGGVAFSSSSTKTKAPKGGSARKGSFTMPSFGAHEKLGQAQELLNQGWALDGMIQAELQKAGNNPSLRAAILRKYGTQRDQVFAQARQVNQEAENLRAMEIAKHGFALFTMGKDEEARPYLEAAGFPMELLDGASKPDAKGRRTINGVTINAEVLEALGKAADPGQFGKAMTALAKDLSTEQHQRNTEASARERSKSDWERDSERLRELDAKYAAMKKKPGFNPNSEEAKAIENEVYNIKGKWNLDRKAQADQKAGNSATKIQIEGAKAILRDPNATPDEIQAAQSVLSSVAEFGGFTPPGQGRGSQPQTQAPTNPAPQGAMKKYVVGATSKAKDGVYNYNGQKITVQSGVVVAVEKGA